MNAVAPKYSQMESGIRKLDNLLALLHVRAAARGQWIVAATTDATAEQIRSSTISQVKVASLWRRCV
jgi:hypothetical protein